MSGKYKIAAVGLVQWGDPDQQQSDSTPIQKNLIRNFDFQLSIMSTTYRVNANDLDEKFLNNLKNLFKDKQIEIHVVEEDATEYILSTEANRDRLLKALEDIESGKELIKVDIDKLWCDKFYFIRLPSTISYSLQKLFEAAPKDCWTNSGYSKISFWRNRKTWATKISVEGILVSQNNWRASPAV